MGASFGSCGPCGEGQRDIASAASRTTDRRRPNEHNENDEWDDVPLLGSEQNHVHMEHAQLSPSKFSVSSEASEGDRDTTFYSSDAPTHKDTIPIEDTYSNSKQHSQSIQETNVDTQTKTRQETHVTTEDFLHLNDTKPTVNNSTPMTFSPQKNPILKTSEKDTPVSNATIPTLPTQDITNKNMEFETSSAIPTHRSIQSDGSNTTVIVHQTPSAATSPSKLSESFSAASSKLTNDKARESDDEEHGSETHTSTKPPVTDGHSHPSETDKRAPETKKRSSIPIPASTHTAVTSHDEVEKPSARRGSVEIDINDNKTKTKDKPVKRVKFAGLDTPTTTTGFSPSADSDFATPVPNDVEIPSYEPDESHPDDVTDTQSLHGYERDLTPLFEERAADGYHSDPESAGIETHRARSNSDGMLRRYNSDHSDSYWRQGSMRQGSMDLSDQNSVTSYEESYALDDMAYYPKRRRHSRHVTGSRVFEHLPRSLVRDKSLSEANPDSVLFITQRT